MSSTSTTRIEPVNTVAFLQHAVQVLEKTGSGPSPVNGFAKTQWAMSGAHIVITRGLLSVYEVLDYLQDEVGYIFY